MVRSDTNSATTQLPLRDSLEGCLSTNSNLKGNILALASITDNGGGTVAGRLLAQNGAVTLNNTHVTKQTCASPTLILIKTVTNDNGGTKVISDFPLFVGATPVVSGAATTLTPGTYTASETNDSGYTASEWGGDCAANGNITLANGDNKTCTINNNDSTPPSGGGGGGGRRSYSSRVPPLINILKVPNPLALPGGPGSVTYTYTVTNIGTVAMNNVTVADNKCALVNFISGDTNGDSILQTNETWIYRCTASVNQTTTNIVTATGHANGFTVADIADATVVVAAHKLPNTGIGPDDKDIPWNIIILASIIVSLSSLYVTRRKQTV